MSRISCLRLHDLKRDIAMCVGLDHRRESISPSHLDLNMSLQSNLVKWNGRYRNYASSLPVRAPTTVGARSFQITNHCYFRQILCVSLSATTRKLAGLQSVFICQRDIKSSGESGVADCDIPLRSDTIWHAARQGFDHQCRRVAANHF